MVVLGLVVAVVGVSWPALRGPTADQRLRAAAKQVSNELARTRLRAMETGTVQEFRYQPGTSSFEIATYVPGDSQAIARSSGQSSADRDSDTVASSAHALEPDQPQCQRFELPDGVSFDGSAPDEAAVAIDHPIAIEEHAWSDPIVFQPDGKTSNARIRLQRGGEAFVEVTLRGLTGVVTAGQLEHGHQVERR
jgi:Tfp pilus assembly protein FimT